MILSLPILGVGVVFVLYGIMWSMGLSGRAAKGEVVELAFDGCAEAQPLIEARLADIGLTEATWRSVSGGFAVQTRLTGDPQVDATIPATLATPGALEVRADGTVIATNADLTEATVRMDLFMVPYVLLHLDADAAQRAQDAMRADPTGKLAFFVDGEDIGWQSNQNTVAKGNLEVSLHITDEEARMHAVAAWSVVLDHGPLPCGVRPR